MNLQLRKGRTDHYCFVSDRAKRATRGNRGEIAFELEFVHAVHIVPDDPYSDVDNVPEGLQRFTVAEFAAWWAKQTDWKVVDV
jgi:hypothetical protein